MKVSVLIPVYNAGNYVREAVMSAIDQPETAEVVLVEDGSPDNSLNVCEALANKHDKVKLYRHPNGENRGSGASRNLAIRKASYDIVAFLDADDFYLLDRFFTATKLLGQDDSIDGVCEAVGFYYQDDKAKNVEARNRLTTMKKRVPPEKMFFRQAPIGPDGYCQTSGWTVRKRLFERAGFFDEHLFLHQDTALFIKFAAVGKIVPGQLKKAVAMRRVHRNNRITVPRSPENKYRDRLLMWETLFDWGKNKLPFKKKIILFKTLMFCFLKGAQGHMPQRKRIALYSLMVSRMPRFVAYLQSLST